MEGTTGNHKYLPFLCDNIFKVRESQITAELLKHHKNFTDDPLITSLR